MVIIGWAMDEPLDLRFGTFETCITFLSSLIVFFVVQARPPPTGVGVGRGRGRGVGSGRARGSGFGSSRLARVGDTVEGGAGQV
eukprot:346971-Prymnesium_polylepis.1